MRTFWFELGIVSPVVTPIPAPFRLSFVLPPLVQPACAPVLPQVAALSVADEQLAGRADTPGGGGGGPVGWPNGLVGGGGGTNGLAGLVGGLPVTHMRHSVEPADTKRQAESS